MSIPRDELCYFVAGRAEYLHDSGERIEILPETLVLFPAGWRGACTVHESMRNTYMLTADDSENAAGSLPQGLADKFAVHHGDDDVARTRSDGAVNQHDIVVKNTSVFHGLAAYT